MARGVAVAIRAHVFVLLLPLVAGCAGSGSSLYLVREPDSWRLQQPRNPRPGGALAPTEPSLDWYAEYEQFPEPSRSIRVRLSGHVVPMETLQRELKGFVFEHVPGLRWPAARGASADPVGPHVLLVSVASNYTVMTLSYELNDEELLEWSRSLELVDEAAWVSRGGVVEP